MTLFLLHQELALSPIGSGCLLPLPEWHCWYFSNLPWIVFIEHAFPFAKAQLQL